MAEIKQLMQPVQYDYLCDTCGEPMRHTGQAYMTNPPSYPHMCRNGHKNSFRHTYPQVGFEPVVVIEGEVIKTGDNE